MKPLYIFDLDGTLALVDHRRHLLDGTDAGWRAFYAACHADAPNLPVIATMKALQESGAEVWIWSGRSNETRMVTACWLIKFDALASLRMRDQADHQPDVKLKAGWLDEMSPEDRLRLVAIFDDRSSVVDMWRSKGVACFQVAKGDF